MPATERQVAILFTDISGYTDYVSRKGNVPAMDLLGRHNALLQPVIEQYGGTFVKGTGDGLIAYFQSAMEAVKAAVVIQQKLAAFNMERREDEEIHIRAAIHVGNAVLEENEIIGSAVNMAARLVSVCKRDQVLISADVYKRTRRAKHLTFKKEGYVQLQGIPERQAAFEVCWQLARFEEKKKAVFVAHGRLDWIRHKTFTLTITFLGLAIAAVLISYFLFWNARSLGPEQVHTNSEQAAHIYEQALNYELQADDELAIQALEHALDLDPNFAEAHLELAFLFYDMEETNKARTHTQIAERLSADMPENFRLKTRAFLAHLEGDAEKSVELFQVLVDRDPSDTDALFYLAQISAVSGRLAQAEASLRLCIKAEPLNPFCHYELMMIQVRNNQFDDVMHNYDVLEKQGVKYLWLDVPASLALWAKGSLGEARKKLEGLVNAKIGGKKVHGTAHFQTGKAWLADISVFKGNLKEATKQLERLLSEESTEDVRIVGLLYLAQIHQVLGTTEHVARRLRQTKLPYEDPKTALYLAKGLANLGESGELKQILERTALEKEFRAGRLSPAITHLFRGVLALPQSRLDDATEEVSLSYELSDDLNTLALLIRLNMMRADWNRCEELASEMIRWKGRILADYSPLLWPLAHYHLAVCYDKLGNQKRAIEYYTAFLQLWSADSELMPVQEALSRLNQLKDM